MLTARCSSSVFANFTAMALKRIRTQAEYDANYAESVKDPVGFWTAQADTWHQKWNTALEWDFETPNVKWFAGGKLNITENCLDRHLKERGNKLAILWEPNDPKERRSASPTASCTSACASTPTC
jgi:acetyl-CoA synthetase